MQLSAHFAMPKNNLKGTIMSIVSDSTHPPIFSARRSAVYVIGRLGSSLFHWAQRWSAEHEHRLATERERAVRAHEIRRELAQAEYRRALVLPELRASQLR